MLFKIISFCKKDGKNNYSPHISKVEIRKLGHPDLPGFLDRKSNKCKIVLSPGKTWQVLPNALMSY
jgi:hypothetical protein